MKNLKLTWLFAIFACSIGLSAQDCECTVIQTVSKTVVLSCYNLDRAECNYYCGKKSCSQKWELVDNGSCNKEDIPSNPCDDVKSSAVNSMSKSYMDIKDESARVGEASGCSPCGGASSLSTVNQLGLTRGYSSRKAYRVWDLGLGQSTNLDFRLTLTEESDGSLTIYQELPSADFAPMYLDGRRGDARDGIFHGSQQNASVEMHLLNSQNQIVQNFADAVKIRYIDFKFSTYEYEVISIGTNEYAGRLVSLKNLNGYGFEIKYKDQENLFTATEIANAPALQWQKHTVTDSTGRVFSFNYHALDLGGEYVISSITLPNGSSINYAYTDTYLSATTYPDNSVATASYGMAANGDTTYTTVETDGKTTEVYFTSNSSLISSHNGQILWNQASLGTGTVVVNGEITYAYFQHPTTGNYSYVYTGEGQLKFRHIDRQVRFFKEDFTFTLDENGDIKYENISGTLESKFLNRNYTGPNGIEHPSSVTDKNGDTCKYHYDQLNRLVFKSYSDNTFEAWSYNNLNLETRHRDRLGRVKLNSYDSRGNVITNEIGILDPYTGNADDYNHKYWTSGNLAQVIGATASQSSNNGNAKKAIDTNTNGQFNMYSVTNTNNEPQPWWKVQLVRSSLVNEVKIYNRKEVPERLADFTVKLFDGATEVYSETFLDPVASEGIVTITPPAGTNADSIQIQLNSTNVLSLAEVEVYGSDSVVDAELPSSDNATSDHAVFTKEYYPTGHQNQYLLKYEFDALNNRTEFIYNANHNLIQINEPDDTGSGYHTKNLMTYDAYGRLNSSTDAIGRTISFEYDDRERLVKTTFNDTSTELNIFGSGLTADLVIKRKDRNGNVTKLEYDNSGRPIKQTVAFSTMNPDGTGEVENTSSLQSVTEKTYYTGQNVPKTVTVNGDLTEYTYDSRLRLISTFRYPDVTSTLISSNEYKDNKLFKFTDPYGRRTYYRYRSADSALIRTIQETVAGTLNLTSYNQVKNQNRDLTNNADYLITDRELDVEGQNTASVDPKNIRHETSYDSRGRSTSSIRAAGSLNQTSETIYDKNSNVIEARNPRYFSEGIRDVTTMEYTRRNLLKERTVASGSLTDEASESFTYFADGKKESHTDFRNNTSYFEWHECCGRFQAGIDQAGHAQFSSNDYSGNVTHSASVKDRTSHSTGGLSGVHDPVDTLTLQEVTTRYDSRHRPIARTVWIDPLGSVDSYDVPIAGDAGVSEAGLTTRMIYFDETTGHPELGPLLTELAADGISFDANNDGAAVITINPEDEVSVAIQDGVGRTIASGMYDKNDYALGTYTLVTWNTITHDTITSGLLETTQTSALDFKNSVRSDGAGRKIQIEDADRNNPAHAGVGNISMFEYDVNSNLVYSRDANGVGQDCTFDDLNRDVSCTDTKGDTTSRVYNLSNSVIKSVDGKGKFSLISYDDRNRKTNSWDRLVTDGFSEVSLPPTVDSTRFYYDDNSNVTKITDVQENDTNYAFDVRNLNTQVTYEDSGVTSCSFDALRRIDVCTDQLGDTVTYNYDLASRMTSREYHLTGSTLESTDTFTFDDASRLLTAHKGRYNNTVTNTFDEIGRKKTEKTSVGGNDYTVTHTFDADNRTTNCAYPAGNNVAKTFTDRNQLATVDFNAANIITSTYDAGMRESNRTFGNSLVNFMTYNLDNTRDAVSVAGKADLSFSYTYDANKNVLSETSSGTAMTGYGFDTSFDDKDRVTQWDRDNTTDSQAWTLDLIGNWGNTTGSFDGNSFNENRTHNGVHELTLMDGNTVTYDDKGNITLDANGNTLVWDIDNHLKSHGTVDFTYDALGRRLEKSDGTNSTLFICDGLRVIEEYEDSGSGYALARSYTYGTYLDDIVAKVEAVNTPTVLYYHSDRQFNVRGLTDSSGAIQVLYAYSVYGKQTVVSSNGTSHNNYGFTGRYHDNETGLWYFRARYFSDEMGRFISRDPLGYIDGMSLYNGYFAQGYGMDPLGTFDFDEFESGMTYGLPSDEPTPIPEPIDKSDSGKNFLWSYEYDIKVTPPTCLGGKLLFDIDGSIDLFFVEISWATVIDIKSAPNEKSESECEFSLGGWVSEPSHSFGTADMNATATANLKTGFENLNLDFKFTGTLSRKSKWDITSYGAGASVGITPFVKLDRWSKTCCKCYSYSASFNMETPKVTVRPLRVFAAVAAYRSLASLAGGLSTKIGQSLGELARKVPQIVK